MLKLELNEEEGTYSLKEIIQQTPSGSIFENNKRRNDRTDKNKDDLSDKTPFMNQFGGAIILYFKTLKLLILFGIALTLLSFF